VTPPETGDIPATLGAAVRREFARALHPPFETFVVVAINGVMMAVIWFVLPPHLKDDVFSIHGSLGFALVLAAWMYSDVPATNVLGSDAARTAVAVGDPVLFRRLLYAKNIMLWTLVTPICIIVAVTYDAATHDALATLYSVIWIGIVPFGVLGISQLVGVLFPYHPLALRDRWEHHRPSRRMLVRWGVLVFTPYVVVPFLGVAIMAPSLLVWGLTAPNGLSGKLPDSHLGWGVALACAVALVCAFGGHRIGSTVAYRRREKLSAYLLDPSRG
jgi:hypothetical protein